MKAFVIVLLVLTVLLLVPLGIDGGYSGEKLILRVRIGFLSIRIFPSSEKHAQPKIKKKKVKKRKLKPQRLENAPEKKKRTFIDYKALVKMGLKTLGRLRKKLHVDYLRLHYIFATDNPFDTALGFGLSSAALGAIMPLVDEAFVIDERDIGTSFDFISDRPAFDCWITLTIHVWEVFYIALAFGIDYLKLILWQKKEERMRKD